MDSKYIIFIAIIIVIIIIIIAILNTSATSCNERYNNYLTGMWSGDPDFLKQSNLKDLQLFIAPPEKNVRQGYIIMTDQDGNFLMNEPIEFKENVTNLKKWNAFNANRKKTKDKFITHHSTDLESSNTDLSTKMTEFPKNLKFGLSMCDGTLTIYDADSNKLSAFLEKDLIGSAAAIEAYTE